MMGFKPGGVQTVSCSQSKIWKGLLHLIGVATSLCSPWFFLLGGNIISGEILSSDCFFLVFLSPR